MAIFLQQSGLSAHQPQNQGQRTESSPSPRLCFSGDNNTGFSGFDNVSLSLSHRRIMSDAHSKCMCIFSFEEKMCFL